ncbi:indoleamine 2,3-dioxygenase 2-like [Lytechinus variegatus]|uniref:indoleamine 2,3-dioxygenase 2-like n=1 Tax=Lytechinus variegatus TaxID=7654 RepID=UPI001BB11355|nr:indoleamine 2,3-dioxygenase 2-like [Lytechinus variegatus]
MDRNPSEINMEDESDNRYACIPKLDDYSASPTFGFVEESPSLDLPEYFQPWVELATHVEELIRNGQIRREIQQLPILDHTRLQSPQAYKAAMVCLVAITHAYVWCEGEDGIPEVLPRCIAVPFTAVADYLRIPPSLTSYGFGLINWKLQDQKGKVELDNIETLIQICGGQDESWFFCTATQVELDFAPALCSILEAQKAVIDRDVGKMIKELQTIEEAIYKMKNSLCRITDGCRPHVFYNVFRPFLAGWDAPAFKKKGLKGLIYEGVSEEPLSYTGGSAAQSSTLPCLDAALGITHQGSEAKLCKSFQQYMPKPHRDLIKAIQDGPSIKGFVHECGSLEAVESFNKCLMAVKAFRDFHIQVVTRYIVAMSQQNDVNKKYSTQHEAGTGGSGFMMFLKGLRDTTTYNLLGRDLNDNTVTTDGVTKATYGDVSKDDGWMGWKRFIGPLTICVVVALFTILIM